MNLKSNNGFSVIELIVALFISGMIAAIVASFLTFGCKSFNNTSAFVKQQDKAANAAERLKKDAEASSKVYVEYTTAAAITPPRVVSVAFTFPDSSKRVWKFIPDPVNTLALSTDDGNNFVYVLDGLAVPADPSNPSIPAEETAEGSRFKFMQSENRLIFAVLPAATNNGNNGFSISKPITTEFSVKYKEVLDNLP